MQVEVYSAPINGLPQDGGEEQPAGIWRSEVHAGKDFDILNVPREWNLTQRPSWKKERALEWVISGSPV